MAALVAAATAQGLALADRLGWFFVETGPREVMFRAGSEMAGNLLLLAAMLAHARYVLLDAEGLLPHREQAAAEAKETKAQAECERGSKAPIFRRQPLDEDRPAARHAAAGVSAFHHPPADRSRRAFCARPRRCCLARQS